jgi:hypothetical protein
MDDEEEGDVADWEDIVVGWIHEMRFELRPLVHFYDSLLENNYQTRENADVPFKGGSPIELGGEEEERRRRSSNAPFFSQHHNITIQNH